MNTKIRIHITIEQEGHEPQEFVQTVKGGCNTGASLFAAVIGGTEKIFSAIHRRYCPEAGESPTNNKRLP